MSLNGSEHQVFRWLVSARALISEIGINHVLMSPRLPLRYSISEEIMLVGYSHRYSFGRSVAQG